MAERYVVSWKTSLRSRAAGLLGIWLSHVHLQVKIRLSSHDWDSINADVTLARTVDQTFLTIDNDTISDTSGESWVSIICAKAR